MDVTADVQAEAREKREALKSSLEFFMPIEMGGKRKGQIWVFIYLSIYGYLQFLQVYKMQWKPCLQKVWMFSWRSWLAPMCVFVVCSRIRRQVPFEDHPAWKGGLVWDRWLRREPGSKEDLPEFRQEAGWAKPLVKGDPPSFFPWLHLGIWSCIQLIGGLWCFQDR